MNDEFTAEEMVLGELNRNMAKNVKTLLPIIHKNQVQVHRKPMESKTL